MQFNDKYKHIYLLYVFFTFATHYVIFRTKDNIGSRKGIISGDDYQELSEAVTRINIQARKEPHYFEIIKTV